MYGSRTQLATIRTPHQQQHPWSAARSSACQASMARSAAMATGRRRNLAYRARIDNCLARWQINFSGSGGIGGHRRDASDPKSGGPGTWSRHCCGGVQHVPDDAVRQCAAGVTHRCSSAGFVGVPAVEHVQHRIGLTARRAALARSA